MLRSPRRLAAMVAAMTPTVTGNAILDPTPIKAHRQRYPRPARKQQRHPVSRAGQGSALPPENRRWLLQQRDMPK